MVRGLAILLTCQLMGELLKLVIGWSIPGPVAGLVLLLVALELGWLQRSDVEAVADALLRNLGLLFVPVGVGLMQYGQLLKQNWATIAAAIALSTLIGLAVTGWTAQSLERHGKRRDE